MIRDGYSFEDSSSDEENEYESYELVKFLATGKFPVLLVSLDQKEYVMKVFPFDEENRTSRYFRNELRFRNLEHPNVIRILECRDYFEMIIDDEQKPVSYTIMEYAPYGDFNNLLKKVTFDDKLVRTYFHQLIRGLEYLHSKGIYHLDIKLANLLLGEGYELKIADFDLAHTKGERRIKSRGSKYFRSPEIATNSCTNPAKADIYSASVVLYALKTNGHLPHMEDEFYEDIRFFDLLRDDPKTYWAEQCKYLKKSADFFDRDFKELFMCMINADVEQRATIEDIKRSKWYNKEIYSNEELRDLMNERFKSLTQ